MDVHQHVCRFNQDTASLRFTYTYGNHGNISQVIDHERGVTVRAEYDLSGRPARKTISKAGETGALDEHIYTGEVTYDAYGNVASFAEKAGETRETHTTTFTYDIENRPTELSYDGDVTLGYTYDALGRITKRMLTRGENTQATDYTYVPGADENGTTALVQSISQLGSTLTYTYDEVGSISSVSDGSQTVTYTYDTLGQLIRADDPHDPTAGETGTTWCYSYDLGGNILSKTAYAYTTGTVGPVVQSSTYTYGDANWKDKLTAFNGTTISYDPIGNPLTDGTYSYTWQHGRQLAGMSKLDGSQTVTFEYNEDGLRTKKTVNGVVTNYILHGSNLVHMTRGDDVLHFFYDAQNSPAALLYNGDWFAYVKNLQSDIIGIVNASGTKVVEYAYDAWGKPIDVTGTMAGTLGAVNPFRYRGYVYDDETGLYYLRSRYYRPEWGRFVNADSLENNCVKSQFAYANGNPISRLDLTGEDSELINGVTPAYYEFLSAVYSYSIANRDNPMVITTDEFLRNCDAYARRKVPYSKVTCATAIARNLKHGMSHTGMSRMFKYDIVASISIEDAGGLDDLLEGSIIAIRDDAASKPYKHGGILYSSSLVYETSPKAIVFKQRPINKQKWNYIGWHKGVRLSDEQIERIKPIIWRVVDDEED